MIFFLKMPTGAIEIGTCSDDKVNESMNRIRSKYEPIFLPKIATITGGSTRYTEIVKTFNHSRINRSRQFQPSNDLLDFINENHDPHPMFRIQPYVENYSSIQESKPGELNEEVEVYLPKYVQEFLLMEGAYQGENACELIREVLNFYVEIRKMVRTRQDPSVKISQFVAYLKKL